MSEASKRCTDCKHYIAGKAYMWGYSLPACSSPNNESLVDGSLRETPASLRYHGECGYKAKWFESSNEQ